MQKTKYETLIEYKKKILDQSNVDFELISNNYWYEDLYDTMISFLKIWGTDIKLCGEDLNWNEQSVNRNVDIIVGSIDKYIIENNLVPVVKEFENETIKKLWKSLVTSIETELAEKDYFIPEFIDYFGYNNEQCRLCVDYNYFYNLCYGIDFKKENESIKMDDIKLFLELAYNKWIKPDKESRYKFTVDINRKIDTFKVPYKLKNGKLVKKGYKTTTINEKIINYEMLERKISFAEEMILSREILDKKCALDYIIDSLQYILSIQEGEGEKKKVECAGNKFSYNKDSKIIVVVKNEIKEIMKIANEFFDIRHNEYLNKAKEIREPLKDSIFIEYLYNRAYALLYILKIKN